MTLLPYYNDKHTISITELEYLSKSNIVNKNKLELFNEIEIIEKNKEKKCKYCSEEFNLITELKKHIISKCFYEELCKRNINNEINKNNDITIDSYNTNNIINNNNCNITNNNNYNLFFNLPIPFEEDWDVSKIPSTAKNDIMISQFVFSRFLKEILSNENNSNVIIDKNNESGKVYINHKKQYIEMTEKDILMKTMEKLYDQLYDIIDNNKDSLKCVKEISKDYIHDKFNKYCKNNDIKEEINEIIIETYDNNKINSEKKYKDVELMNKNEIKLNKFQIINKDNRKIRNKKEVKSKKEIIDNIINAREEDLYYFYDSDANTKA
jgi:hypothetical protein